MEEPDETELTPAENNVYYRIAIQGVTAWNIWINTELSDEQRKKAALSEISALTSIHLATIAKKAGVDKLPDPHFISLQELRFSKRLDFSGFIFISVSFAKSIFEEPVDFSSSVFVGPADFEKCHFNKTAIFDEVEAFDSLRFDDSDFRSTAEFTDVSIKAPSFEGVTFSKAVDFARSKFLKNVSFKSSVFCWDTNFNSVEFGSAASFDSVEFREVPQFHQASLNQDTSFLHATYPLHESKSLVQWNRRERAWRALKQKMNNFHSHQEELFFFAKELDARARSESNKTFVFMVAFYNGLCGFGTLIRRPAIVLMLLWAISSCIYYFTMNAPSLVSAASISFSNTIPFVGQSRLIADVALKSFSDDSYALVYAFSVVQGLLSAVLLFLVLLGIRNHFRLK